MNQVDIRGIALHVEDTGGDGPPALFLHGFLFDGRQYSAQVSALRDRFRCITVDFPGQGRSGKSTVGYGTQPLTGVIIDLLDHLDLGPVHFVGLSMGGFTGMRIAVQRPDLLASLTLLNTSAAAHARTKFPKQLALAAVARVAGTGIPPVTSGIEDEMYAPAFRDDEANAPTRRFWREQWAASDRAALVDTLLGFMRRGDYRSQLPEIACPTLVIAGGSDASLPPAHSIDMYERIPGSQLRVLRGVGHCSPLEAPESVTHALGEFWVGVANPAGDLASDPVHGRT